jgi:hypothetical protein
MTFFRPACAEDAHSQRACHSPRRPQNFGANPNGSAARKWKPSPAPRSSIDHNHPPVLVLPHAAGLSNISRTRTGCARPERSRANAKLR